MKLQRGTWGLLAAVLSVVPAWSQVDFGDLAIGGPPGIGSEELRPRDDFDALDRGLIGGSPKLEEWFENWSKVYRERFRGHHAGALGPVEGGAAVFDSALGEWSWRASSNRRTVLQVLGDLSPPGEDPERTRLLDRMVGALAMAATDPKRVRGNSRRPALSQADLARTLLGLARRPQGLGPDDKGELEKLGISVWDYKAAAFVLLQHVVPRRGRVDNQQLTALIDNPPDPADEAGTGPLQEIARQVLARARQSNSPRVRRVERQIDQIEDIADRRNKALRTLRQELGDTAMTSPELLSVVLRQHFAATNGQGSRKVREALLELGRTEAELIRIGEDLEMPSPDEISTEADGELFVNVDVNSLGDKLGRELLNADLKLSAKLFDIDLAPGVSLAAKYKYELEGGWKKDTWNRIDEWELRSSISPFDSVDDVFEMPFSIGLHHSRKIMLVRQFPDHVQALKTPPKTPISLPLTVARAKALPMGYFWSLPAEMSAVARLGTGYSEGIVGAEVYANYLLQGRFRMNFFKESPSKMRLQIIGIRDRGPGVGARIKIGFDVFGIRIFDKALDKLVGADIVRVNSDWRKGMGLALDYVYDLDDADAAKAFEKAVRASLGFGPTLATNPLVKAAKMEKRLLTDLRPTEKLFLEDRQRPVEERRIDRRFMARNVFQYREKSIRIGPRLARYGRSSRWIENDLTVTHREGAQDFYRYPLYNHWNGWSLLFGVWKESAEVQAFSLMEVPDLQRDPQGPQDLIMKATFRDRKASQGEVENARELALRNLGPFLSQSMGLATAPVPSGGKGFRAHVMLAVHPPGTSRMLDPARTPDEAVRAAAIKALLAEKGPDARETDSIRSDAHDLIEPFLLVRQITGAPGNEKQVRALLRLAELSEWRNNGARFFIELLGGRPTTDEVHVDVAWHGKGITGVLKTYGEPRHENLYRIVSEALSAVSDRDRPFGEY